jgi:hypothetical protein
MSNLEQRIFFQQKDSTLSLVVLAWLQQLQQFFLNDEHRDKNEDWNKLGKYTGTTKNIEVTPLGNINFLTVKQQNILTQITKIEGFKPFEQMNRVCTSLEEWALRILHPNNKYQLKSLYKNDGETEKR